MQVVAYSAAGEIPNLKRPEHGGAAHIEVAILEAEHLVHLRLAFRVDLKGQRLAVVQHLELARVDLDGARGDPRVLRARGTRGYRAAHGHHELPPDVLHLGVGLRPVGGIEDTLGDPLPIADVDKDEPAVIAPSVHPAHVRAWCDVPRRAYPATGRKFDDGPHVSSLQLPRDQTRPSNMRIIKISSWLTGCKDGLWTVTARNRPRRPVAARQCLELQGRLHASFSLTRL